MHRMFCSLKVATLEKFGQTRTRCQLQSEGVRGGGDRKDSLSGDSEQSHINERTTNKMGAMFLQFFRQFQACDNPQGVFTV